MRRWPSAALLVTGMLVTGMLAQPNVAWAKPSNKDRQAALKLGGEALDLFAAGDFEAALAKFGDADALLPAPTLKLHIARCLDKLDRMKEAAEKYREVIATELAADAPAVHREARQQAVPELAALLEATPTVRVVVKGAGSAAAQVKMDGAELAVTEIGEKMSLDPGHYRFDAEAGDKRASREIDLERGGNERVVLHFANDAVDDKPVANPNGGDAMAWQIGGWTAIGLGGAGIAVGAILGGLVLGEESDLETRCPNRECPPSAHDDAESFDTLRIGSTVGFIAGGVVAAAGVVVLLLAPDAPEQASGVSVYPIVSPGYVGVGGTF